MILCVQVECCSSKASTKIQIATRSFYFVLPPPVGPASAGAVSSLSEHPAQKSQLALTSSIRHSAPPSPNVHELPWPGSSMLDSLSIPNSPVHQDFSPSSDPELDDALVSIDDLAPEEQDQFKNAPHDSDSELASHRKPGTLPKILPNGKGAQTGSLSTMSKVATQSKVPILPKLSSRSKPKAAKSQPAQPPQERPPPEQMPPKPPYTYAILCYRAIAAHNGQASLSEIVSWIRDEFEWYRWNDECGWEVSRDESIKRRILILRNFSPLFVTTCLLILLSSRIDGKIYHRWAIPSMGKRVKAKDFSGA